MSIATKSGDKGNSSLYDGKRLSKSSAVFDVLGQLDELHSRLGFSKFGDSLPPELIQNIEKAQDDIYRLMSVVGFEMKCPEHIESISKDDVEFLNKKVEDLESQIKERLSKFIRPGTTETAAKFHLVRTACRTAERKLIEYLTAEHFEDMQKEKPDIKYSMQYLNRLSDLAFLWAYKFEEID